MIRYTVLNLKDNYAMEMVLQGLRRVGEMIYHNGTPFKVLRIEGPYVVKN